MPTVIEHDAHKRAVRKAFDHAAATYDSAAAVQREVCARLAVLAERCPPASPPLRILDAGCGTGHALSLLAAQYPAASRLGVDFAPSMLVRARCDGPETTLLCGDLEALPLANGSVDAVWSSLSLQWCDPDRAVREFARVLAPGGMAWVATLAPGTLGELREAFLAVDDEQHVIGFLPPHVWLEVAREAGFRVVAQQRTQASVLAPDLRGILRHLKSIGANRVSAGQRAPLSRSEWRTLEACYEGFRREDGMLSATYDVFMLALRRN